MSYLIYKVKTGHDQPEIDLVPISPQPRSQGIQSIRRDYAATDFYQQGLFVELKWSSIGLATDYETFLTQFGLDEARVSAVTISVPDYFYEEKIYNGYALRPEAVRDRTRDIFVRNVTVIVRDLVEADLY
jgi:hypothetical protein